jgi:hypothetical protein
MITHSSNKSETRPTMKAGRRYAALIVSTISVFEAATAFAQVKPKTAGIGLRGSYWNMQSHTPTRVAVFFLAHERFLVSRIAPRRHCRRHREARVY